jgi:hypothetical protein
MEIAFFVIAVIGLLALSGGGTAATLSAKIATPTGPPQPWTPAPVPSVPPPQFNFTSAQTPQFSGAQALGATAGAAGIAAGVTAKSVLKVGVSAIPIVGAAVSAAMQIASALLAAHNLRKKQATNENTAMNLGVQGWDSDTAQVNKAYNARQITAQEAIKLMGQVMAQYWALVGGQIQPGRNACQDGANCPPNWVPGTAWPSSGEGAACLVGCAPLLASYKNAVAALQANGGNSAVIEVYGNTKYGGSTRLPYTLTWQQG